MSFAILGYYSPFSGDIFLWEPDLSNIRPFIFPGALMTIAIFVRTFRLFLSVLLVHLDVDVDLSGLQQ